MLLAFSAEITSFWVRGTASPNRSREAAMAECRSLPQMCLLGPVPPRTPGRSDAHVPSEVSRGESKYGRIPFVYFYHESSVKADAAFGLLDIEISIQRRGPKS